VKPLRHPLMPGPGHRLPLTLLHLTVRNHFLRAAADIHCTRLSDRQAAAWLRKQARSLQGMRMAQGSRRTIVSTKTCRAHQCANVVRVEMLRPGGEREADPSSAVAVVIGLFVAHALGNRVPTIIEIGG
jgi:hypothetical protein